MSVLCVCVSCLGRACARVRVLPAGSCVSICAFLCAGGDLERVHECIVLVVCMYAGEGLDAHVCVGGVYARKFAEFFSLLLERW